MQFCGRSTFPHLPLSVQVFSCNSQSMMMLQGRAELKTRGSTTHTHFSPLGHLKQSLCSVSMHFSQLKSENIALERQFLIFKLVLWAWTENSSLLLFLLMTLNHINKLHMQANSLPPSSLIVLLEIISNCPRQKKKMRFLITSHSHRRRAKTGFCLT